MSKSKTNSSTGNQEKAISKTSTAKATAADTQMTAFDKAMTLFHKREFKAALPLFETAEKGVDVSISQAARMHASMCRQRLERDAPRFQTAEDNYAYGLALANRRDLAAAERYLNQALQLAPRADHVLYTLALVKGLQGDIPAAAMHLAKSIEIQPANRASARTDSDFHDLLQHQAIRDLVH